MLKRRLHLSVPYFKQDTDYTCGPASVQMVLAYHGIRESEERLTRSLHTDPERGTPHQPVINALIDRGLYCYANESAPIEEIVFFLGRRSPIIVHWLETDEGVDHYSVVVGIDEHNVFLNDPWNGERLPLSHHEFTKRWECGALGGVCRNWLLAVSHTPFQLGRQFVPRR